jgi:hydrophobic/amphiphilic exporter-1 (mainly G- bacteria), HAE1 family
MSLPGFSVRRRVTVLMATLAILVFGWFSLKRLEIKLLPEISYPTITVRTTITGAPPEEVENLVSRPIEEALGVINDLQSITSVSMAGMSDVILELNWNSDVDKLVLDIREKLNDLHLPDESEKPRILRYNPETEPVLKMALNGDDLVALYNLADQELKPRLESIDGVASAQIIGGDREEIRIEIDANEMASRQISYDMVSSRLVQENINRPGGILEDANAHYLVRTMNEFRDVVEIGDIVLSSHNGADVRLRDIATIQRTPVDKKSITHLSGRESVGIDVFKEGDANIIAVADRVIAEIGSQSSSVMKRRKSLTDLIPEGVELMVTSNQSTFIKRAIEEVKNTAFYGCILAVLVLFLFLRSVPHTLTVAMAIPISIVATFTLLFFRNISLNLMSLGGIALGVGMLVDNAIVVLENIFRHRESGDSVLTAAHSGGEDVATAVTASTLTTIAVFFPIVFVTGITGQIFGDLAWTVAFSLLASLVVALSVIPMITSIEIESLSGKISPIWLLSALRKSTSLSQNGSGRKPRFSFNELAKSSISGAIHWLRSLFQSTFSFPAVNSRILRWMVIAFLLPFKLLMFIANVLLQGAGFMIMHTTYLILMPILSVLFLVWRVMKFVLKPILALFDTTLIRSRKFYLKTLNKSFNQPGFILLVCLIFLLVSIIFVFPRLGMNLIPSFAQGEFYIDLKMPVGTPLEETEKIVYAIETCAQEISGIRMVSAVIGSSSGESLTIGTERENLASIQILLEPDKSSAEEEYAIIDNLRERISAIPGVEKTKFRRPSLFTLKTPLEIELRGYDLNALLENATRIVDKLKQDPEFADVYSTLEPGYPEVQIVFNRVKLARLGLSPAVIADFIHQTVEGDVPTNFGEYGNEIDVRLRAKRKKGMSIDSLKQMIINPGADSPVYLSAVSEISEIVGPSEIRRVDQHRVALIRVDVRLLDLKGALVKAEDILLRTPPDQGVTYAVVGQSEEMNESVKSLRFALLLAVFLVYLVMASQFESLLHPLIIILSIPLAVIGVLFGLWIVDIPLSVVVFMGMIVLAGIAVNNAIVLIDTVNQLRTRGEPLRQALLTAGSIRFRPILMTALTTILGLLPMAIDSGPGSEIRIPLAVTIILGLLASTFLTLIVIPLAYLSISKDN